MNSQEMQMQSLEIIQSLIKSGASLQESMVILAMTLAATFRGDGLSQHEAINRFTTIVKNVYEK